MIKMAEKLDYGKPIANTNSAGITFIADKVIGSGDRDLIVARAHSGKLLWSFPAAYPLTAPPIADDTSVYLALQSGLLLNLHHADGKLRWQTKLNSYVSRPLIITPEIVVAATASQHLYAIDAASGKTLWLYDSESRTDVIVQGAAPPLIVDKTLYYGTAAGNIVALELQNGKQLRSWSPPRKTARFNSIVGQLALPAPDTLVFATAAGVVAAIDPNQSSSEPKWQQQFSDITTFVCHAGICYVGLNAGEVVAIDSSDGSVRWHRRLGWSPSFITPHRKHLYLSGSNGFIAKLRVTHGSSVWQEDLGNSIFAPPIIRHGMIFFSTGLRNTYVYRL